MFFLDNKEAVIKISHLLAYLNKKRSFNTEIKKKLKRMLRIINILIVLLFVWQLSLARAEQDTHAIIIKDHKFAPAQLTIPSKTKVKIFIENQDSTPEEFESFELNREKVVAANGKVVIFIGPLRPGVYRFFGEFHKNTAQGQIVVQ